MKWLSRALVFSPYCYGLCYSEAEFQNEMRRLKVPREQWPDFILPNVHASTHFFTTKDGNEAAIICIGRTKRRSKEQVSALLVHEAVHVWQYIKESLGENVPSKEFEAYAIQNLVQNILIAYNTRNR